MTALQPQTAQSLRWPGSGASQSVCPVVAQLVHVKHQAAAVRETAEVRAVLAELVRRGRDPGELMRELLAGGRPFTACDRVSPPTKGQSFS